MLEGVAEGKVKARIPTANGDIEVEGNVEDIQKLILSLANKKSEKSIKYLLLELISNGFLEVPKSLTEIRTELSRKGFNVASSSLFPILQRDILREGFMERRGKRRSYKYYTTEEQRKAASVVLQTR